MSRLKRLGKSLKANAEYLRILLLEFKWTLLLIVVILMAGSLLFHVFQEDPGGTHPDYAESLYRTFVLMSMNFPDTFPRHPVLRFWCFFVPFLSFLIVSEAFVRLVVLLSSRASSGRRWVKAVVATYDNHVILCGIGRLGFSVLLELTKMGKDVVVIDCAEHAFGVGEVRRMGLPLIIGDARSEQSLVDAGIHKAHAVIAATDDDMGNLEIALDARTLRPGIRVVMRMFDERIAQKIARSFDIKLIFSPGAIAAPSFAAATIDRTLVNSFYIDDKQLQTVKLLIGPASHLIGKSLGIVRGDRQLCILSHRRFNQGAVLFPPEETLVEQNDKITVLAQGYVIGQLHEMNRDQPSPVRS
jgi:Trk K+ transport system NAD-binding subunit